MTKREALLGQFSKANECLREALARPKDGIVRDSAIQRFEFTTDLAWKLMHAELNEIHKITCTSPGTCLRAAFKQGIIADDIFWLDMIEKRNLTSHTYIEALAERVYSILPNAQKRFDALLAYFNKTKK
ncbi:MAG: HI0074 family nucleotidyltransferase substrate-binding subunit [bacterium]|nr:HI0074 family nucleotidyltransferase substrate-binding subunit [bacterium]